MNNNSEISPAILRILAARGITEKADIAEYMAPRPKRTYDPFLMKGMEEAVGIILKYAAEKRKICVYGDYDADGITSVSVMMTILGELGADADYYIPSRFTEGYGLNMKAIDIIADRGTELLITVDNGSVAFNEVSYMKAKGMEVIVTDHHNVSEQLPDCIMLNPKQPDDPYPFSYLCGCGVAFKLTQAICRRTEITKKTQNSLLDIVGIATVGDIVPLVDENRTLVKYGMDRIRRNERPGLASLLEKAKLDAEAISSYNIAFGIVPRLNSCGRMKTADMGVKLLTGSDNSILSHLAGEMNELNNERKELQEQIFQDAVKWIDSLDRIPEFIVYYAGNAHEGVTGIVASKVKEKYYRPVVILTDTENGGVKGTGRSIEGVDLHAVLSRYSDFFYKFGGHAGACGFSMGSGHIDALREGLNAEVSMMLKDRPDLLEFVITPDAVIDAEEVTLQLAKDVQMMEPFGEGNPKPVFRIGGITVKGIRRMGDKSQYRKFTCHGRKGRGFDVICFDKDMDLIDNVENGSEIDVMGEVDENLWNGRSSVQVILRQINSVS